MGENRLRLIPLYDTTAVLKNFKYLVDGLEAVIKYTDGDSSIEKILNDVLSGRLLMWIGFYNSEYCGYVTTSISTIANGDRTLWIMHAYKKPNLGGLDVLAEGQRILIDYARRYNCKTIRFYTLRGKAFERKLKGYGWKQTYQEFCQEIGG